MQVNVQECLKQCGLEETIYPGKRVVKKLPQSGEFKSHCVVYDWRVPELLKLEIKAGLSGKDLKPKELAKYPISFQSPTYMHIATAANVAANIDESAAADDENEDEEEGKGRAGKSGGGGKKMKKNKKVEKALHAFSSVVDGKIPELGEIKKLVVMGKEIAKDAIGAVLECLAAQIKSMTVVPVNVLASVTSVTKIAPGGRPASEISAELKQGTKPYNPKDMFGAAPS